MLGDGITGVVAANRTNASGSRLVGAILERIAHDVPTPRAHQRFTWARSHYLMLARTSEPAAESNGNQDALFGRLFLLPRHVSEGQKNRMKLLIKSIQKLLLKRDLNVAIDDILSEVANLLISSQIGGPAPADSGLIVPSAHFVLYRSGELRLRFFLNDLTSRFCAVPAGSSNFDSLDTTQKLKISLINELSAHFYYFVRDISHKHYHHHKTSDHILLCLSTGPFDDYTWRRETLYALTRAALHSRRLDDLLAYRNAKGLIAYADLFQSNNSKIIRTKENYLAIIDNPNSIKYDFNHLISSVEARADEKLWRYDGRVQLFAILVTVALAVFALWIYVGQVASIIHLSNVRNTNQWQLYRRIASAIYAYPITVMVISVLISACDYDIFGRGLKVLGWFRNSVSIIRRPFLAIAVGVTYKIQLSMPRYADSIASILVGAITATMFILFSKIFLLLVHQIRF
jgi:hypothetical protein